VHDIGPTKYDPGLVEEFVRNHRQKLILTPFYIP
jgi:hypothetical protein